MGHLVRMPALEPAMMQGTVLEWLVDEGESVSAGDRVATVEAVTAAAGEAPIGAAIAREEGRLRRRAVAEGESVSAGMPVAIVAAPDEDVGALEDELETAAAPEDAAVPETAAVPEDAADRASANRTRMPGRTVTASTADGMRGRIRAGAFEWRYDEPAEYGGTETGPTPVDVFLGGLAACLSLSVRFQAEKRDAAVDEISVTADATPERGSVEEIDATIRLETDADDATVERIVDLAERGCHVSQLLADDATPTVSWERR